MPAGEDGSAFSEKGQEPDNHPRPQPPPVRQTLSASNNLTTLSGKNDTAPASRHSRVLLAVARADLEEISSEFASVDLVRASERKRVKRIRPAKYLRESQPKSKYVTDPRALTMGHQDLKSAQYLIRQLDHGRIERLRRFQPKARRRRGGRKGSKGKRRKKRTRGRNVPSSLDGIFLGDVNSDTNCEGSAQTKNQEGAMRVKGASSKEGRLAAKPNSVPPEGMTFISRPSPHCHTQAAKFEHEFADRIAKWGKDPKLMNMMNHLVRLLKQQNHSSVSKPKFSRATTGTFLWSSLPLNLQDQILGPAVQSYYESNGGLDSGKSRGGKRNRAQHDFTTTSTKLDELYDLQSMTFEQQVEAAVHDILAWFFAQHERTKLGKTEPRTGRAAVVKRYEEFCKQPGGGNGVVDIAAMTARHSSTDPLSTANNMANLRIQDAMKKREKRIDQKGDNENGKEKLQRDRDFVEENKAPEALIVRMPDEMNKTILAKSRRRRQSMVAANERRESLIIKKHEDVRLRTLARMMRIHEEMEKAEAERKSRMWQVILKVIIFHYRTFQPFLRMRAEENAAVKLQGLFRKKIFETRGPIMFKVLRLVQKRILPRLQSIRLRLKARDANQMLTFIRDINKMGRVTFAIRTFKNNMVLSQRIFRGYMSITDARLEALERLWIQCEKKRQEKIIETNKLRIAVMKKHQLSNQKRKASGAPLDNKDVEQLDGRTTTHRKRKQKALQLVGDNVGNLKRIEKHIDAMAQADEVFKEAVSIKYHLC